MAASDPRRRLREDSRTANLHGSKHAIAVLAPQAGALWLMLRADEPAVAALVSSGPLLPEPPAQSRWGRMKQAGQMWLVVRTPTRLLALPILAGDNVAIREGPWQVELAATEVAGSQVRISGAEPHLPPLLLQVGDQDLTHLQWATHCGATMPPAPPPSEAPASPPQQPEAATSQETRAGSPIPGIGGWVWERPVTSWQDAEHLAADHMRHLGFTDVYVTGPGTDHGIDVIAPSAAAQVKFQTRPAGGPDIQQLAGAAHGVAQRLFYATAYTDAAVASAEMTGVALFAYEPTEGAVAPVNASARSMAPARRDGDERGPFGTLTLDGRRTRALRWAGQIQDATKTPISNRKRKGIRQLEQRQQALGLVVDALALLESSGSPMYRKRRAERLVHDAEKQLRKASTLVSLWLR